MENCIFCKIVKKEIPSTKIYEDEKILAFLDIQPVNFGHTLVIPKTHFRNALETPEETLTEVIRVGKKIGKALMKNGAEGIGFSFNNEEASGQSVFHTHLHVMPRMINDGHKMWDKKEYKSGELEETAQKITQAL